MISRFSEFPFSCQLIDEKCCDKSFFINKAESYSEEHLVLLLSEGSQAKRRSFLFRQPLIIFTSKGQSVQILTSRDNETIRADPLTVFQELLDTISVPHQQSEGTNAAPIGFCGYLAYELKNQIEAVPQTAEDDLQLPDIWMMFPGIVEIFDHDKKLLSTYSMTNEYFSPLVLNKLSGIKPTKTPAFDSQPQQKEKYIEGVKTIRDHILHGRVYQANLTRRISLPLSEPPFSAFKRYYNANPADQFAFIQSGDHQILSTSMELFLQKKRSVLESRPIKGTRPRGTDAIEDEELKNELVSNKKEGAELSMIVDLMRNDLSRVCTPGSVSVPEHKKIESYRNVHHLVSTVRGKCNQGTTFKEIINATFPAGSISGCPKIAALSIIDSLEPLVRHVYTGSIGYVDISGDFTLSVAIRSAVCMNGMLHFGTGGGITWNSEPEAEWKESMIKAETLFEILDTGTEDGN